MNGASQIDHPNYSFQDMNFVRSQMIGGTNQPIVIQTAPIQAQAQQPVTQTQPLQQVSSRKLSFMRNLKNKHCEASFELHRLYFLRVLAGKLV